MRHYFHTNYHKKSFVLMWLKAKCYSQYFVPNSVSLKNPFFCLTIQTIKKLKKKNYNDGWLRH